MMARAGTARPDRDLALANSSVERLTYGLLSVADMDPFDLALAPDGMGRAAPDETVDALDTSGRVGLGKPLSHRSRHIRFLPGCVTTEMAILGRAVRLKSIRECKK